MQPLTLHQTLLAGPLKLSRKRKLGQDAFQTYTHDDSIMETHNSGPAGSQIKWITHMNVSSAHFSSEV